MSGLSSGLGKLRFKLYSCCQGVILHEMVDSELVIESFVSSYHNILVNDAAFDDISALVAKASQPDSAKLAGRVVKMETDTGGHSAAEITFMVVTAVVGVALAVILTNYLVSTYRKHSGSVTSLESKSSSGWVWLNRETLEHHSVSTKPSIMPLTSYTCSYEHRSECKKSISRQSSTGTYRGSECSIKIKGDNSRISEFVMCNNKSSVCAESLEEDAVFDSSPLDDGITQDEFDCMRETYT